MVQMTVEISALWQQAEEAGSSGLAGLSSLRCLVGVLMLAARGRRSGFVVPRGLERRCENVSGPAWLAATAVLEVLESLLGGVAGRLSDLAGPAPTRGLVIRLAGEAARMGRDHDARLLCLAHAVATLADPTSDGDERSWSLYHFYLSCQRLAAREVFLPLAA